MKYLLDTHIWLWSLLEPDKLDADVVKILENTDNELFISPITVWETLILAEKKRRRKTERVNTDKSIQNIFINQVVIYT